MRLLASFAGVIRSPYKGTTVNLVDVTFSTKPNLLSPNTNTSPTLTFSYFTDLLNSCLRDSIALLTASILAGSSASKSKSSSSSIVSNSPSDLALLIVSRIGCNGSVTTSVSITGSSSTGSSVLTGSALGASAGFAGAFFSLNALTSAAFSGSLKNLVIILLAEAVRKNLSKDNSDSPSASLAEFC